MRVGRSFQWMLATVLGLVATLSAAQPGQPRVALAGHTLTPELLATAQWVLPAAKSTAEQPMTITVVLRRDDETGFARFLADLYDHESPNFRRFPSPEAVSDRFGPSAAAWDVVTRHFAGEGFALVEGSRNRMTLVLSGTRAQVEHSFSVSLADLELDRKRFIANVQDPSLPASVARHVQAVMGLSTLAQAQRLRVEPLKYLLDCSNNNQLDAYTQDFCKNAYKNGYGLFGAFDNAICSLLWNWFGTCTNLPPPAPDPTGRLATPKSTGTGQKVGLAQFDSFLMSDVADFLVLTEAPVAQINRVSLVNVNGGATPGPDQSEVLLDINAVMTMAPGADVVVYSAPFTGAGSFQGLFNRMIVDGMTVISNSWAYCENQTTLADVQSIDSILATAAASGISVLSASGDSGSTCLNGAPNTIVVPAGAPHATAVGGTTATFGPGGLYAGETWWNGTNGTPPTGQGGYGTSQFFARPSYQNGLNGSGMRSIPDVAVSANPVTHGIAICQASNGGCPNGLAYGGTSASAPFMAGLVALLNESMGAPLGWLNPQFYPLAATNSFHSAASMGSDFAHVGLGSPNISLLALTLRGGILGPPTATMSRVQATKINLAADGADEVSVIVQLRDAQGVTVVGKTVSLAKNAGSSATVTPPSAVTNLANGAAVFTVKTLVPETILLTATDITDGFVIAQTVTLNAQPPTAASGGINASPNIVLNDGVATTTITVTLQDALARPSPGKLIQLSQGAGRSIISSPTPPVTNASGQVQFTATNLNAEAVTYTAIDITDGNLPVPGSAIVTFGGQGSTSCVTGPPPAAAPGFVLTPFSAGYQTGNLFFGNVNWGCRGATFPGFATDGSVFVNNFIDGGVFKLPPQGGAPTSGNKLSTLGPSLNSPVFGKNGKLYATRGATTGNFFTGAIIEIDPTTGAAVRTVMSGLTCPTPLVVDPLSGDLFTDDSCFGAGSDNPSIWRIANPDSASPTLSVYTTLPSTPTGWLAFAPDGTLFVPQHTTNPAGSPVLRISGTNVPGTPTQTPIPGLNSLYWVTVGEALPSGAAKSLIILDGVSLKLQLADITTNPPTFTDLTTTPLGSGVVGPDGCLYISTIDSIYKLAPATGGCGFAVTNPAPMLLLSPTAATPMQGTVQTLTAQLTNLTVPPDTPVIFTIGGANVQTRVGRTNATGSATVNYPGIFVGTDAVYAEIAVGANAYRSMTGSVQWMAGKHPTIVSLDTGVGAGMVGASIALKANLTDISFKPPQPVAGATVQFTLGLLSCNGITDVSGNASCNVTPTSAGRFVLSAAYAGTGALNAAADSRDMLINGPPSIVLATSLSPTPVGTPFTLTATVSGTAPTGTVSFRNEQALLPNCAAVPLVGAGNARTAQCTVSALGVGSYALTADYSGDGTNAPSTATLIQVVSANAGPPCGGFSDVDPASPFCPNVEWLKNRQVTLGCTAGLYCPNDSVIRLSMAAFMNRLGTAGTGTVLSAQAQPGAINLDNQTVVCQTTDFAVIDFPRLATVDAILSGQGAASVNFIAEAVASFDAGTSWAPLTSTTAASSATAAHWGNVRTHGVRDLDVGQSVRFGLRVGRGGLAGSGGLTASRCNLRALIGNRTTQYAPLDR